MTRQTALRVAVLGALMAAGAAPAGAVKEGARQQEFGPKPYRSDCHCSAAQREFDAARHCRKRAS